MRRSWQSRRSYHTSASAARRTPWLWRTYKSLVSRQWRRNNMVLPKLLKRKNVDLTKIQNHQSQEAQKYHPNNSPNQYHHYHPNPWDNQHKYHPNPWDNHPTHHHSYHNTNSDPNYRASSCVFLLFLLLLVVSCASVFSCRARSGLPGGDPQARLHP